MIFFLFFWGEREVIYRVRELIHWVRGELIHRERVDIHWVGELINTVYGRVDTQRERTYTQRARERVDTLGE